jgi:transcription elongation factor Elf1
MAAPVKHCVLCRSQNISVEPEHQRIAVVICRACGATVRIEFDPPDAPGLRGRIDVLVDPADPESPGRVH